ncbi:hypothetical protein CsSME_00018317 [Camellia sinensis var. sinensis]
MVSALSSFTIDNFLPHSHVLYSQSQPMALTFLKFL